jgi:acyl-CoA hydrolase
MKILFFKKNCENFKPKISPKSEVFMVKNKLKNLKFKCHPMHLKNTFSLSSKTTSLLTSSLTMVVVSYKEIRREENRHYVDDK